MGVGQSQHRLDLQRVGIAGLGHGAGQGTTTIDARLNGVTGTTQVTVSPAALVSIAVSPVNPTIAQGTTQQFTASGDLLR